MSISNARAAAAATLAAAIALGAAACVAAPARAARDGLSGAWSARWCDAQAPERDCGGFQLDLVQVGARLCGRHWVGTLGLARLDEGEPGSVKGTVVGDTAVVVVRAARDGSTHLARAVRAGDTLRWEMVGMLEAGEGAEPTILPLKNALRRTRGDDDAARLSELAAACRWPDEAAPPP